jgi:hypothetical protein
VLGHEAPASMRLVGAALDSAAMASFAHGVFFLHPTVRFSELARITYPAGMGGMSVRHRRGVVRLVVHVSIFVMRRDVMLAALVIVADLDLVRWTVFGDDLLDFIVTARFVLATGLTARLFRLFETFRLIVAFDGLHVAVHFPVM